jgi:2-oxoglutarate ferredoxin oxidoreductase subunit gamma
MTRPTSIVMTGRGGQGGKLAMELLAWSASSEGLIPVLYSIYGALIRGGDIASTLLVGSSDPGSPLCDQFDFMCALHNNWFDRYYGAIRPGGLLIFDEAQISPDMCERDDVRHLPASFSSLAALSGDPRSANMVAAGILASVSGIASSKALEQGMAQVVPAHRKDRMAGNLAAVDQGFSWAASKSDIVQAVLEHRS